MSDSVDGVVHTSGPWAYSPAGAMVFADGGQRHIADVRGWGQLSRELGETAAAKQQDANGRLIAAAPDLLEALQLLWTEVALSGNGKANDFGWRKAREKTLEALEKATVE